MPKLSAVIITLNEEKNIERCIKSLNGIADDIVVIDSFSTDRTEEICKRLNARFIQNEFKGHIEQKNFGISKAKFPYILSLDADEALSDELKESIKEVKENWKFDGYYFNRLTNYCGKWIKHNSWYPSRKLRLWDSRKGRWGGINPHDKYILDKGATQKFLKGDLLHYSYYTVGDHLAQINKFSTIVAKSYFDRGRRTNSFSLVIHTSWRFFRDYFIKLGFLDGFYGFVVCVNSAHEVFLKYVKLKDLWKEYRLKKKTKICFFNTTKLWGGGEKWHYDISNRLNNKGYDVLIITNKKSTLFKKVNDLNIPNYSVRVVNLSFLNVFKLLEVYRILKKENVKTIVVNLSTDLKVAGPAARLAGVKNVIYRRGSAKPIRNTALNRFLLGKVVTKIIANSEETRRSILANNERITDRKPVEVIYNGIDLGDYLSRKTTPLYERKNGEVILGNAGRLSEEKGHKYLLELASILKKRKLNFVLLIAGIGKQEAPLKKLAEKLDVSDKVKFLGFVDNINRFNISIDMFLLSSIYEGFGYVMIEAMAMKKPVIAFDIKSSAEIVVDQKTGFLIEGFNVTRMADKVETLVNNSELRNQMGQAGMERVKEKFIIEKTLEQFEEIITTD